jgi:single-strand DNA-binding protein
MQLIGLVRLGSDAELRYLTDGTAVSNLSLAYSYGRKDQDGKKPVQWIEGTLWSKQAEALVSYLTKGKMLCVTVDDLHVETFNKADGTSGTKLTGRISSVEFAGDAVPARQDQPQQRQAPAQRQAPQQARQPAQNTGSGFDDMDCPF